MTDSLSDISTSRLTVRAGLYQTGTESPNQPLPPR